MNLGVKYIKALILIVFIFSALGVQAEPIDDTNKYARFQESSFGTVNFNPANGSVIVTDSALTGNAWGDLVGWINLEPDEGGVLNDGNGNLSGHAWGENTGWINFNPANGGVTIDSSGDFAGYAWSQNYGWIVFNCATDSSCGTLDHKVSTTWGVVSEACGNGIDDDGDGLTDYPNDPGCSSSVDTDESDDPGSPVLPPITPTDVCPNIGGTQSAVPAGLVLSNGLCVSPEVTDVCPNVSGDQTTLPTGTIFDDFGNCVTPEDPNDVCPNIGGDQASVPAGRIVDAFGNCIIPEDPDDVCVNIAGDQGSIPSGMVRDAVGNCVNPDIEPPVEPPIPPGDDDTTIVDVVIGGTASVVKETFQGFKDIYATPTGEVVTKTISTVGVVAGGIAALSSIFLNPSSLTELALAPFRLWSLLLAFLGLRKKYKPWGTVYDSVTKQPLDPAYVVLQDEDGKEISSSITDLDGRYGFLTEPGRYKMIANKTNYSFPSKKLAGKTSDELYSNLYFGENLVIHNQSEVITKSIPMDPVNFDWNEFAKKNKKLMKFHSRFDFIAAKVSNILFILGFIVAVLALFVAPQPYNTIVFGLYVGFLLLRLIGLKPKTHGYLIDSNTGNPFSFAIIRVMSVELDIEIAHKISDRSGRYFCLIPNGKYYVKVEKKNEDESYELVHTSEVINVKKGIIHQRFKI
jgi:hypothetical protein